MMPITLTKRQSEIFDWVLKGASNKQIAKRLGLSEATIKLHMGAIFKKYGVQSRLQLCAFAQNNVKLSLPSDLEAQPFGWILTDGNSIKGIVTTKTAPSDNWKAFYIKQDS
jgi:DNA-binding CsgD family transcriptional regulator